MKIAYVGLANSHPFTDAEHVVTLRDDIELHIWDEDTWRMRCFAAEYPDAVAHRSFDELLAAQPDGALITVPPNRVAPLARALLTTGCAVAITKPAATCHDELAALEAAVAGHEERVLTTSILRFAPDLAAVTGPVEQVHVVAAHDIAYWAAPESRWQDEAGGLVPMMGTHAFELLEAMLGPTMRVTGCVASKASELPLTSPDIASGTASNADGVRATFEIDGTVTGQSYRVEYTDADGRHSIQIGANGGADPFGSEAMTRHLLAMADGTPSPLAWDDTAAVLRAVADARRFAEAEH